jgi:hypothetical protein
MTGQFRQSVFGRLGGYEDVNDAGRLGQSYAFDHAPSNSQNKYVSLSASHFQAPTASIEAVVAWLRQLK